MYHYLYKITNDFDECYYYGIHSTEDLDDRYMGSGLRLWNAYRKHGLQHFNKEILEYFETREQALKRESEIVTEELIKDELCYNIILGGGNSAAKGTVTVQIIKTGERLAIPKDEYHNNKHLNTTATTGIVACKIKDTQECILIDADEFHKNRDKYIFCSENRVSVKDSYGNNYSVLKSDPHYISKELVPIWTGKYHKEESKLKLKQSLDKIKHQQGEKNSNYDHCWINKNGQTKSVHKNELQNYLNDGWILGRILNDTSKIKKANQNKIWIHKDDQVKFIYKSEAKEYKDAGWCYGRTTPNRKRKRINLEFWNSL